MPTKSDGTPLLDTSKLTDASSLFENCKNLTKIPKIDTSKVTNMASMFGYCSSLTEVPELDTRNVTSMGWLLIGCTSLSDESLNNILAMCTNATQITKNKTLNNIGLTEDQANKCKTLSNYEAFTKAGWTTGY